MDKKAQNNSEPLTLEALAQYSNEALLPAINKQFEKRDKVLTTHSEQFSAHGELLHKIVAKLAEHDEGFEKVATKEAVAELRDKILTALDENTELLCTMRQEQDATSQAIVRYDEKIARLQEKVGV